MAQSLRAVATCTYVASIAAQSTMTAGCDTHAMLRDITSVQTACCPSDLAADCATGLPDTCSDTCRPVFLGFLSTYRQNGCAPTLEIFGESLNLHPLEVDCNGGVDQSHRPALVGVCDMDTALATCQAQPVGETDIASMCADPCMRGLIPCASDPVLVASEGAETAQLLVQLQQLCGAEDKPGGNQPGDGQCSVADMQNICHEHPVPPSFVDGIATDPCINPCVLEMLDCASDPTAADTLGQTSLLELQHTCQSAAGDTGPGDGHCNLVSAGEFCGADDQDRSDPDTFCQHDCVREMIDCIDDPQLADHRSVIANMQSICSGDCVEELSSLNDRMQEPCCGSTPCPSGPPEHCSVECSQLFIPFYGRCGAIIDSMAPGQPKDTAADLARFYAECQGAVAGSGH